MLWAGGLAGAVEAVGGATSEEDAAHGRESKACVGDSHEGQTRDDAGLCGRPKAVRGWQEKAMRESCGLDPLLPRVLARGPFWVCAGSAGTGGRARLASVQGSGSRAAAAATARVPSAASFHAQGR